MVLVLVVALLCVGLVSASDNSTSNATSCTTGYFPCSESTIGSLLLVVFYGAILGVGAKLISDGAELVLDLFPSAGSVIGALLLPVLGALPDSAMIIVSGAFGLPEEAQVQLGVGMGTLAGSTIMLLTVPWTASLFVAACDLNDLGEAKEKTRTYWSLTRTGITVDHDTRINARLMLASLVSFFVVQCIAFKYLSGGGDATHAEYPFAVAGFALCTTLLVAYCVYQILVPKLAKRRLEIIERARAERNDRLRALYIIQHFPEVSDIVKVTDPVEALHSKTLEFARHWKRAALNPRLAVAVGAASSSSSSVNNAETEPLLMTGPAENVTSELLEPVESEANNDDDDDDDDEEQEPEENPREHFWKSLGKACLLMFGGTGVVFIFSDPMVDVISTLGHLWGIAPFYISFVLTPFCSNASELVASLAFSSKKKIANTSMSLSQLYGAVIMNNTMGLGIFFALVAFRGLAWTFTAETLAIMLAVLAVGIPAAIKTNFSLVWAFFNAPVYVLSILFVYLLEEYTSLT